MAQATVPQVPPRLRDGGLVRAVWLELIGRPGASFGQLRRRLPALRPRPRGPRRTHTV